MAIRFLDTNILLSNFEDIKELSEKFYISSKVLEELENIKTSSRKDEITKYQAREVVKWLYENEDKYRCVIVNSKETDILLDNNLEVTNDNLIIATAVVFKHSTNQEVVFVTNDNLARLIARDLFELKVEGMGNVDLDQYKGYKVLSSQEEIAKFYETKENTYGLLINEYLIITDEYGTGVDAHRWTKDGFVGVSYKPIKTFQMGKLTPRDFFQACAIDSLYNNQLSVLKGKAGGGKSLIAMTFLFHLLEKGDIEKIIVFTNDVPAKGARELGYLKGDVIQKQLDSTIGNFLSSKLGDRQMVEMLLLQGKLLLIPASLARGYDTSGQKCAVYVQEIQNSTPELMRLLLTRVADNTKVILDGDLNQIDSFLYEGSKNGLRVVSKAFRGNKLYGEIELQNVYRSEIAKIAEGLF